MAVTVDKEVLERESRIYGRSENWTLSKYEEAINRCALACCEEDVSLLKDRKKLFELAREKADSGGYSYKKQRSRSKVFGDEKMAKEGAKRQKLLFDQRQRRTEELVEDMTSATDTIKLLELQRSKFVTGEKYLQAAEVVSQITEWRGKQRKLQGELSKLQKADARSMKYHKGKSAKGRAELKTMERFIISKSKGPSDVSTYMSMCLGHAVQPSPPAARPMSMMLSCKKVHQVSVAVQVKMLPVQVGHFQPNPPAVRSMFKTLSCKKVHQVSVGVQAVHHVVPSVPRQLLTIRVLHTAQARMDKVMIHFFPKPHGPYRISVGHKENAVLRYSKYLPCTLSNVARTKDGIYYSLITDLTLKEFIVAREDHCERNHLVSCKECTNLTDAAKQIDDSGIVPLRSLFASHFLSPGAKYKSDKAIRRILQLPVAIFPLELQKGQKKLFVTEVNTAVNYEKLGEFLRTVSVSTDCNTQFPIISRETLKIVCDLASSEKDKRLIKYALSCGGNMSREAAKKKYGISDLTFRD